MSRCQICQADGLEFHETLRLNINPITGQKHGKDYCKPVQKPQPVPRFDTMNGITFDRSPYSVAADITRNALAAGLDPFKVRLEVRETVIILH
jgi:hypothetical protein